MFGIVLPQRLWCAEFSRDKIVPFVLGILLLPNVPKYYVMPCLLRSCKRTTQSCFHMLRHLLAVPLWAGGHPGGTNVIQRLVLCVVAFSAPCSSWRQYRWPGCGSLQSGLFLLMWGYSVSRPEARRSLTRSAVPLAVVGSG